MPACCGLPGRDHVADVAGLRQPIDRREDTGPERGEAFDHQGARHVDKAVGERDRVIDERECDFGKNRLHRTVLKVI